jgi:hypothetical protein
MKTHRCEHCGVVLTDFNTSCDSAAKEMCQECYTDKVEALGWEWTKK